MKRVKLYQIPRDSKIYEEFVLEDGTKIADGYILFRHVDGSYSYCECRQGNGDVIYNQDGNRSVVHLHVQAELEPYKDGYKLAEDEDEKQTA